MFLKLYLKVVLVRLLCILLIFLTNLGFILFSEVDEFFQQCDPGELRVTFY